MILETYTIGHSNHEFDEFIRLLGAHDIEVIADVRSNPYSQYNPQYNRENLRAGLESKGYQYVFLGREFGARRDEEECYRDGVVSYDLISQTEAFRAGVRRMREGCAKYRVALMCAEKDPLQCHRTILVSRHLQSGGFTVRHVLANGTLELHTEAESRLLEEEKLVNLEFDFGEGGTKDYCKLLNEAYAARSSKIAYKEREEVGQVPI